MSQVQNVINCKLNLHYRHSTCLASLEVIFLNKIKEIKTSLFNCNSVMFDYSCPPVILMVILLTEYASFKSHLFIRAKVSEVNAFNI
jgi:hypothetical protein